MDTKTIINEINNINEQINILKSKIEEKNKNRLQIMELCPHEIVFKYNDNFPRKMIIDGTYYCPACSKTIKCIDKNQIINTSFNNSKVIPLLNLSLIGNEDTYDTIKNEVYSNLDFYYSSDTTIDEMSLKMEEVLKDKQNIYNKKEVIKRYIYKK